MTIDAIALAVDTHFAPADVESDGWPDVKTAACEGGRGGGGEGGKKVPLLRARASA